MKKTRIILAAIVCCGIMALVDGVLRPGYGVKSAIKAVLFLCVPLLLCGREMLAVFRVQKRSFAIAAGLGLALYAGIVGGYFLLRGFIDFSQIAGALSQNAGVRGDNFLWVSLYISFCNSLLEEFFFRGFLFLHLKKENRRFAYCFSAAAFSAYHTAMMLGWFDWWLLLLVLAGLFVGGMLFNRLDEKSGTIYTSYFVHMFANFAINTVGFILLK